jgi:hypothetical protein
MRPARRRSTRIVRAASIRPPYSDAADHTALITSATDSFGCFSDFFAFGAGALSVFFTGLPY